MINLWLDDERPAPEGWTRVCNVNEAIILFINCDVNNMSLDHDLGSQISEDENGLPIYKYEYSEKTGLDFLRWIHEHNYWNKIKGNIFIHSMNPVGKERMIDFINDNWRKNARAD